MVSQRFQTSSAIFLFIIKNKKKKKRDRGYNILLNTPSEASLDVTAPCSLLPPSVPIKFM